MNDRAVRGRGASSARASGARRAKAADALDSGALAADAAGGLLGAVFGAASALRHDKPLHPRGIVYDARLRRDGSPVTWQCRWLDEPGDDHGTARLSRSAGLAPPLPDIHGLAITFTGDDGERHDLLLATTGTGRWGRFVLAPRTDPYTRPYTSLFPYRSGQGLVLLAATPTSSHRPTGPPAAVTFRRQAARVSGPWHAFGTLELLAPAGGLADDPVRYDPVMYPLPDLRWPTPLIRLREPAYAAARRTPARAESPRA